MTPSPESVLFFASLLLGFLIGFFYEIFRFLRIAIPHNTFFTGLEDLLFFLSLLPLLIFFHYALSDGILRWFSLFGCLGGFLLYLGTVGRLLCFFAKKIIAFVKRVFSLIFRIFFRPVVNVFKNITNYLYGILKRLAIMVRTKGVAARRKREKGRLLRQASKGFMK